MVTLPRLRDVDRDVLHLGGDGGDVGGLRHVHRLRLHYGHRAGHVLGLQLRLALGEHGRLDL